MLQLSSNESHCLSCPKQNKINLLNISFSTIYVSSIVMLTKFNFIWIIDSRTIDQVTKDQEAFEEFCQYSASTSRYMLETMIEWWLNGMVQTSNT